MKKILYTTRKNVADQRIRHFGKFITLPQALKLLGKK